MAHEAAGVPPIAPPQDMHPRLQVIVDKVGEEEVRRADTGSAPHGLRIIFQQLSYHVPSIANKKERAHLLKDVTGFINPHELTALMGPSGSGKTTLLDVLAGRKSAGITEGSIVFGGQKASMQYLRRFTGYVEQFDTLIGSLTVNEMLMYTAEMKRNRLEPLSSKQALVDRLLGKLALEGCRDVLIGSQMTKGISGGQAKRTNIGIALITNPRVLFLDEPTSGLDSYISNEVMTVVKQLVADGTTICATIHSPTSQCFNLFDRLIMLVKGKVVYFGPTHGGLEFANSALTGVKEMSEGYNEAEFLVDYVTEADRQGKGEALAEHYTNSELHMKNCVQLAALCEEKEEIPEHIAGELATTSSTTTPWWWGLKTLMKYRTMRNYRDGTFLAPRIGDKIMVSLLIMTLYLNIGNKFDRNNYTNISAVLFMCAVLPAHGGALYVPSLVLERNLFVRERADGMYHVITYFSAKMCEELLLTIMTTAPVSAWVFVGLKLQGLWVLFWLVYMTATSNGIVLAYWIAALSPNMDVANAVLPTYVVTLFFFSGFLFRFEVMPFYWKWYSYINFLKYSWGSVMLNQFTAEKGDPVWIDGLTVLEYYNLKGASKWNYLGYLALFFPVFFTFTWFTLSYKKYSSR
ncbi:P-loop containing nucleoside triphosphate hydrolase protein [Haematococcus lacustris]